MLETRLLDFVTAEMLAQLLAVDLEEIDGMLKRGALPRPVMVGGTYLRFDYRVVRAMIVEGTLFRVRDGRRRADDPLLPQTTPSLAAVPVFEVRPNDAQATPQADASYHRLMSGQRRRS